MTKQSPFKHSDGSNCWTVNCRLGSSRAVRVKATSSGQLSKYKTEQVGLSAEVAIADMFNIGVDNEYRLRADADVIDTISPLVLNLFTSNQVPAPVKHVAEKQNPVDFLLRGGKTLSVKSNMRGLGKICPQNVGQPSSKTFWERMPLSVKGDKDYSAVSYDDSKQLFKELVFTKPVELLNIYWTNLFDADHMVYFGNILDGKGDSLSTAPVALVYNKSLPPVWDSEQISFTQTMNSWNESNTIKYKGVSIGEWQVHSGRDCFKFRFNLAGLRKSGLL